MMTKKEIIWEVLKAAAVGAMTGGATIEEIRGTKYRPPARRKPSDGGRGADAAVKEDSS